MARGNRKQNEDVPNELDSVFRDAVLRPYRAAPRHVLPDAAPEPAQPAADESDPRDAAFRAEINAMYEEVVSLHKDLDKLRADSEKERESWTAERMTLLARVDELAAELASRDAAPAPGPSPELVELARGIAGLTERMRTIAARPSPGRLPSTT